MRFSVTCNTRQNACENTDLTFGIHLKIINFACLKKLQKLYEFSVGLLQVIY